MLFKRKMTDDGSLSNLDGFILIELVSKCKQKLHLKWLERIQYHCSTPLSQCIYFQLGEKICERIMI